MICIFGIIFNKQSILVTLMCIELMLLSLNLNFIIFSVYLDDMYGQIFMYKIFLKNALQKLLLKIKKIIHY